MLTETAKALGKRDPEQGERLTQSITPGEWQGLAIGYAERAKYSKDADQRETFIAKAEWAAVSIADEPGTAETLVLAA